MVVVLISKALSIKRYFMKSLSVRTLKLIGNIYKERFTQRNIETLWFEKIIILTNRKIQRRWMNVSINVAIRSQTLLVWWFCNEVKSFTHFFSYLLILIAKLLERILLRGPRRLSTCLQSCHETASSLSLYRYSTILYETFHILVCNMIHWGI